MIGDLLASVGTLSRHVARLARDRRRAPGAHGLPCSAGELAVAWLSRALGLPVVELHRLGGHDGTSARARLGLRYAAGHEGPATLFAKLPSPSLSVATFGSVMALGANEVRFYRTLSREVPVTTPRPWLAQASPRGERFVLLLEDLEGCCFGAVERGCSAEQARAVVGDLARLHALFWESPRLSRDLAWLPRRGAEPAPRVARLLCRLAAGPALRRHGARVSDRLRRAAPRIQALRERLEASWAEPPLTLLHGDPHLGNLYFQPDGRPGFLDWQVVRCGQGMRDVSHFLISSLAVANRRAWEDELLRHYVESLAAAGVRGFALADARRQLCLHSFYEWFASTVTAAAGALQSEAVAAAAIERAAAAIEDHDALNALEALPAS